MSAILDERVSKWIIDHAGRMEGKVKFASLNSIRFLRNAMEISPISSEVSSFCALHATEEAVSAFLAAAKGSNYKDAKLINPRDHLSKSLVVLFAERLISSVADGRLAISVSPIDDCLSYRLKTSDSDNYHYGNLHLSSINFESVGPELGVVPELADLIAKASEYAEIRNKIIYATKTSLPYGFKDIDRAIRRESKLSLGLIWAAIDIATYRDVRSAFVERLIEELVQMRPAAKT